MSGFTASMWLASQPAASTPLLSQAMAAGGVDYLRVSLSLAVCLLLAIGIIFFLRKTQRGSISWLKSGTDPRIKVVESLRLDARTKLLLIECDGRTVLLSHDAKGVLTVFTHSSRP